jgi:hypothetical protein
VDGGSDRDADTVAYRAREVLFTQFFLQGMDYTTYQYTGLKQCARSYTLS